MIERLQNIFKSAEIRRQEQVNAYIDGDLSHAEVEALMAEASDDPDIAHAVAQAEALRTTLDQLGQEPVPSALSRRLKAIPGKHDRWRTYRWIGVAATVLLATFLTLRPGPGPSDAEIAQARKDWQTALHYLATASAKANEHITASVDAGLNRSLSTSTLSVLSKHLDTTLDSKEN